MATSSGTLTKLKIEALTTSGSVDSSKKFEAMINPESYNYETQINYNTKDKAIGQPDHDLKYVNHEPESVSFSLYLDGTGVVSTDTDIAAKITKLKKVIYAYVGTNHEPSRVQITWGTFIFKGRVQNFSINYSLFKPDGTPIRAKIELSFLGFVDSTESAQKKNASSPDMSHIRTVFTGSSLPLMCKEIYKDESMYLEVAKSNGLISFRKLQAGTQVYFPPIKR